MKTRVKEGTESGEIVKFDEAGMPQLEVWLEDETIWLTQKQMAELFGCVPQNITYHLREIFKIGELADNADFYIAGAKLENGKLLTNGGRVLNVVAKADTLEKAIKDAYKATQSITFDNAYCRKDIGQRALKAVINK